MAKKFSKSLHTKNDNAKLLVIKWLESQQYKARVNPDPYGIDVLAEKKGIKYRYEVEVKHNWTTDDFPFDTIHFSARKRKYVAENSFFVMLNSKRTMMLVVGYDVLKRAKIVTKSTIYTTSEQFIEVPVSACTIYPIEESTWETNTKQKVRRLKRLSRIF